MITTPLGKPVQQFGLPLNLIITLTSDVKSQFYTSQDISQRKARMNVDIMFNPQEGSLSCVESPDLSF